MERIKTAFSTKKPISEAVEEIKETIGSMSIKMLVFFASPIYDPEVLSTAMHDAFPGAVVFGCTTSGEIITGKMLKESVVAMALSPEAVSDAALGVITGIKEDILAENISRVFTDFETHCGEKMQNLDFTKYVGIILIDGLSASEEKVMDRIGDLTNVLFVGGSAGDDLKFACTYVYANGKAYTNAAVIVLLKPAVGFDIIKTQSFSATDKRLIATEVEEASREVVCFNNKPAADAYAEAVGTTVDDAPNHFMSNPVGLLTEDDIYVRSPQQIRDGKMVFYCNVLKDMELALLNATDIIADTKKAIMEKKGSGNAIAGIINFHCILRTLELENDKLTDEYGELFSDMPTIGFSTYGEEFLGHINQTSTMLLFK